MSVVRVEKNKNYTVLSNYHLRDKNLSLKAKGLLSVVLSLPDNWNYSIEGLVSMLKEERRSVKSTIEELVQNKYLIILKLKAIKGIRNNIEYLYNFYEKPFNQEELNKLLNSVNKEELIKYEYGVNLHGIDIHGVDIQNVGLQIDTQINKDILSKDILSKDILSKDILSKEELNKEKIPPNNNNNNNNSNSGGGDLSILSNKLDQKLSIYEYVERNFARPLGKIELETIDTWEDNDVVRHAVDIAVLNNKHSIAYVEGILRRYKDNDVSTLEQAKAYDKKMKSCDSGNIIIQKKETPRVNKQIKAVELEPGIWAYTDEKNHAMTCSEPFKSGGKWFIKDGYGKQRECLPPEEKGK